MTDPKTKIEVTNPSGSIYDEEAIRKDRIKAFQIFIQAIILGTVLTLIFVFLPE